MPKFTRPETVTFAAGHMKKNPEISMGDLKKLGKAGGYKIYPLILGLARKELGWKRKTPSGNKPGRPPGARGPGRPPGTRGPGRPPGKRGPGRPRKNAGAGIDLTSGLNGIVTQIRGLEREADALRKTLSRIAELAAGG